MPQKIISQHIRRGFPPPFAKQQLITNDTIKGEIIGSIQLYSEVRDFGKDILKSNRHPKLEKSFKRFQAYTRQAIAFFETAENLSYRASPLIYYYSFMNFAKAVIFLRDSTFTDGHIHHGLTPCSKNGNLKNHFVTVKSPGVFSNFYYHTKNKHIPNKAKLKIIDLLSYGTDIAYEFLDFKMGKWHSSGCKYAIVNYASGSNFHGLIALYHHDNLHISRNLSSKEFQQIELHPESAFRVFNLSTEELQIHKFYETKHSYPYVPNQPLDTAKIVSDTISCLPYNLSYNPFDDGFIFTLNAPVKTPKLVAMDEMLAIYSTMFYLGSLVRYRPQILENMLATKDAWLIERFVNGAPQTFLRHLRNMLDNKYFAYAKR